ncbi:MAG TPA: TIGR03435 family protein [Vicinamibacterales bacterium]|jgi:hypothetical protein|nr:TIGR03435 family protein [Vicinamibacterales bacterium]
MKVRLLGTVGIVAAVGWMAAGRAAQAPSSPGFEVASIKPNNSVGRAATMGMQPGRYMATDRTGATGTFVMELTWTPDQMPLGSAVSDPSKNKGVKIDPNGPSIFTALQEQLGLKLQSAKGPVDVFVIDRVERPTKN